jgi:hypothetical protein
MRRSSTEAISGRSATADSMPSVATRASSGVIDSIGGIPLAAS